MGIVNFSSNEMHCCWLCLKGLNFHVSVGAAINQIAYFEEPKEAVT